METKPNSEKISTAPDSPTTTNEEILKLLRQLVGQDSNANEPSLETSPEQAEDDDENDIENNEAVGKLGDLAGLDDEGPAAQIHLEGAVVGELHACKHGRIHSF